MPYLLHSSRFLLPSPSQSIVTSICSSSSSFLTFSFPSFCSTEDPFPSQTPGHRACNQVVSTAQPHPQCNSSGKKFKTAFVSLSGYEKYTQNSCQMHTWSRTSKGSQSLRYFASTYYACQTLRLFITGHEKFSRECSQNCHSESSNFLLPVHVNLY